VIRVYSEQKESRECVIRVTGVSRVIESDSDSESAQDSVIPARFGSESTEWNLLLCY
jgi:hypothetical protein